MLANVPSVYVSPGSPRGSRFGARTGGLAVVLLALFVGGACSESQGRPTRSSTSSRSQRRPTPPSTTSSSSSPTSAPAQPVHRGPRIRAAHGSGLYQQPAPRAGHGPIVLSDRIQVDLLVNNRGLPVLLNGLQGASGRLTVVFGRPTSPHRIVVRRHIAVTRRHQTFRVGIDARSRRLVSGCTAQQITAIATVRRNGRSVRHAVSGRVFLHPPNCRTFFGPDAVWNVALARHMPLDPSSRLLVGTLTADVARLGATLNTYRYSTPVYTVPRNQKRVSYTIESAVSTAARVRAEFAGGVPVPAAARASGGSDGQLTVWQPASDTLWELYKAHRVRGRWYGGWGAAMTHVSANMGVFPRLPGGIWISTTATGLPLVGGLITLADLRRGRIDHALQIALPDTRASVESLPAVLNDGFGRGPATIPEGTRFRLPSSLDIAQLHLPRLTRMLAYAAQRYGIIVDDTSGAVTFRGQDPLGGPQWHRLLAGQSLLRTVSRFPFARLQVVRLLLIGLSVPRPYKLADGRTTGAAPAQRAVPQCYLYGIACS